MASSWRTEKRAAKRMFDDDAYVREAEERARREAEFQERFGALEARLEELGIEPSLLAEYITTKER